MILFNHISNTCQNLRANRTRNFLTVLGITIGAACIAIVLALTNGANSLLEQDLSSYAAGTILIRSSQPVVDQGRLLDLTTNNWVVGSSLSQTDISELQKLKNIKSVAPVMPFSATVTAQDKEIRQQMVIGTSQYLTDSVNLEITHGQFFNENIVSNATVLGEKLAMQIFNTPNCVGQTLTIRGQVFLIVGVASQKNYRIQNGGIDFSNSVIINTSSARQITNDTVQIKQINIQPSSEANLDELKNEINQVLQTTHTNEKDYTIIDSSSNTPVVNQKYSDLSQTTLLVAIIALVIGGIGVMNIMLVSVAEQTHEIGIRRSIGATTTDIAGQFLVESMVISLLGGLLGLMSSFVLTFFLKSLLPFPAVYSWELAAEVLGVTMIIGTIAGILPAIRAASKNPIEALRQS